MLRRFIPHILISVFFGAIAYLFTPANAPETFHLTQPSSSSAISALSAISGVATDSLPALADSLKDIDQLLVAWKSKYRMRLYYKGEIQKTYYIALGQSPLGPKEKQGDNKTPEGVYHIIQKSKGPFSGDYSQYLGVAWMRINYPNNADAYKAYMNGYITRTTYTEICDSNNAGKEPPKNTYLGGGIGFHGWWGNWPGTDQQNLTWGCISIQNDDLLDLYDRVNLKTEVIILP